MTDISWIAALLSPRSVSPHANFRSVDKVTPAGLLGLVATSDERSRDELIQRLPRPLTSVEADLIDAARESTQMSTLRTGAERLAELATGGRVSDDAIRATAALLAAASLSELDEPTRAVTVLQRVIELVSPSTDDGRLLCGALLQQQAMRACEAGIPHEVCRDQARDILGEVDVSRLSRYPTSLGSRWPSLSTNRNLLKALQEANQDLFDAAVGFPDAKTLKRLLKTPTSPLVSAMARHAEVGEREYISEAFSAMTRSSERSVRSQDPVDHPVWRSLMFFELLGHRRMSRSHRAMLGELRMLRSEGGVGLVREGLRLLRHAGDIKNLKLALGLVRTGGPLEALAEEARSIATRRLAPALLRDVELATLEASAQLLGSADADNAFSSIVEALGKVPIVAPFRRELPAVQLENLFKAAAALAPVADRVSDMADRVLESAVQIGPTDDQLLVRAHAKGLRPMNWDEVDQSVKNRWRAWLAEYNAGLYAGWGPVVNMVAPEMRTDEAILEDLAAAPSLDRVANEINAVMNGSQDAGSSVGWLREVAIQPVADFLDSARDEARKGIHSMYSVDPADLAVALIQLVGADLWEPVTGYLLDPHIPRSAKTAALNRIAASPEAVPTPSRRAFAEGNSALLEPDQYSSPFEAPSVDPYPAAVRLLASLDLFPTDDLLSALAVLAAGPTTSRLEAARTLSTVVSTLRPTPEWAVAISLQLSSDPDSNVRGETGRTLGMVLQSTEFARGPVQKRLVALLEEDGMLVPLLVLHGLTADIDIEQGPIRDLVESMARSHPVFGVRVQARYVLGELE